VGSNGTIYATSVSVPDVVYAIDPTTGNATIISGNGIGGTTFGALSYGIALYPALSTTVPEPSSVMLLAFGIVGVILLQIIRVGRSALPLMS
jgi:PEP-CTERM motif